MTRKAPRDDRVRQILGAAVHEFVEKGYEGASIDAIAARAGLTKGAIYHHFGGKDELLLAANGLFMQPVHELMDAARRARSPLAGLRRYVRDYLGYWSSHDRELVFVFLSFAKVLRARQLWPLYAEYFGETAAFFEDMLARAVAAAELPPHDARARAACLLSALDGLLPYVIMVEELKVPVACAHLDAILLGPPSARRGPRGSSRKRA